MKKGQKHTISTCKAEFYQTYMEERLTSVTLFTPSTVIILGKKVFSTRELQLQSQTPGSSEVTNVPPPAKLGIPHHQ